ncbi:MAG: efflux RND transporter periplasmic adaptor subunit [Planctomycetota bacterium]
MADRGLHKKLLAALVPIAGTAAIIVILAWLMGAFDERVEPGPTADIRPTRPAGAAILEVAAVEVPIVETAVGTISPVQRVMVGSKLLARIQSVHVERAGQRVTAGQLLFELDDADLRGRLAEAEAALAGASADLRQAETDLARVQALAEQGVAAKERLDRESTRVEAAKARVDQLTRAIDVARTNLGFARIASPIDGIVIDKRVSQGDLVQPGQILVELYDPLRMQLIARVRESLAARLAPGREVEVSLEALDLRCHGHVDEIVPEAEARSRVFEVKVSGPCPPDVLPGMFGRLFIPVGKRDELRVPAAALLRIGQLESVWVVTADDRMLRRYVQTGRHHEDGVEILSGLSEGETILARAADAAGAAR